MPRKVAIVGVGLTRMATRRNDLTHPELSHEAVNAALSNANLTIDEIDSVIYGTNKLSRQVGRRRRRRGSKPPLHEGYDRWNNWNLRGARRILPCGFRYV